MIKKNEKGFALVLSLVLLMAMTLMGGALIVISASDHRSNNTGDEYQQTFYVAETALYEGEKYVLNQFLGPYATDGKRDITKRNLPANHTVKFNPDNSSSKVKDCFYSFPDIDGPEFKVLFGPPPNNPTLLPFAKGQIKSTTLMPVSNNSISEACSENVGAALCIGIFFLASIGPALSTG